MLLDIIKNIRFESITSEVIPTVGQPNFSLTINWSAYKQHVPHESSDTLLQGVRLRCFVATTPQSAAALDFITQRFNEYLVAEQSEGSSIEVSHEMFTNFVRNSLSPQDQQYLSSTNPVSPYSVSAPVVTELFRNPHPPMGQGERISDGVVMYDEPLVNLAAKDADGGILELASEGEVAVPLAQPTPPTSARSILETIPPEMREALNGALINKILRRSSTTNKTDKVFLTPITLPFVGKSIEVISQLSLYVYAYVPSSRRGQSNTALGVPITPITAINLKGVQNLWMPATADRLLVRKRAATPGVMYAPQDGLLHILDNQAATKVREKITMGWNSFFSQPQDIITQENSHLMGLFQPDAPYSKLWATVDHNKSVRFSFAIDQAEFLKSKSVLPYFYSNSSMVRKLLTSSTLNTDQPIMPSAIRSIKVKRHLCDRTATMPGNDVSTSAHLSPLVPDDTYRAEYVSNPKEVEGIIGFSSQPKIKFFEGMDKSVATKTQNSIFYSVDIEAYDAAPAYLRQIVKKLFSFQSSFNRLYSHLVDIHDRSAAADMVLVSLQNYTLRLGNTDERYDSFIIRMLEEYVTILNDTLPGDPINITPYLESIRSLAENIPLKWLSDIQNMLNLGVNLYFNKLKSIFPQDPLGDIPNNKLMALESVGLKQTLYPIVRGEHKFSEIITPASQVSYGQDFIFSPDQQTRGQKHRTGLMRLEISEMFDRFSLEFSKYFQPAGTDETIPLDPNPIVPDLTNSIPTSMSYLSPRTITMPSKKPLDQTSVFQKRGASYIYYDLNRYGDLFVELVRTKSAISQLYYGTPVITNATTTSEEDCGDITTGDEENLYSSLVADLGQTHAILLDGTLTPQYSGPRIVSGEYEPTEGLTSTVPYLPGPLAVPSIIGGLGATSKSTETYISSVDTTFVNVAQDQEDADKGQSEKEEFQRPIKFPFAIFGEMSIDRRINLDVSYQDEDFNSMRGLVNAFGINNVNVREMIEGPFGALPFQLKSMLVVAASSEGALLFPASPRGPFNATRPVLYDHNPSTDKNQMVSFWESGLDQPDYGTTLDPMKMYSKFLAFWLNYKQLGTIECLNQFATTSKSEDPNVVLDQWIPFSAAVVEDLGPNEKMLCRVRPLTKSTYKELLPSGESCETYIKTSYGETADVLALPIYNQYFVIEKSIPQTEDAPLGQETTSQDEESSTAGVLYSGTQTTY